MPNVSLAKLLGKTGTITYGLIVPGGNECSMVGRNCRDFHPLETCAAERTKKNPAEEAGFNEAMSIYDILCDAKEDCSLSGVFCPTASLKGIVKGGSFLPGEGGPKDNEYFFDTHFEELKMACEQIGGVPEGKGDAAYRIRIFPFLPLRFQFWRADEDFEPEIQFLWDENVLSYLHFETLYYVMGHILQRLKELIQKTR
jgi:hypothetical protein